MVERKGRSAPPPFEGYTVYGPTVHKNERRYVHLVKKDYSHRGSMSLARYLMSVHLGRLLGQEEHVDHIDGDFTNDDIENLQILSPADNLRKSHPGPTSVHGTLTRYSHHKCRCEPCKNAWNEHSRVYRRAWRARNKTKRVCRKDHK